MLAPSASSASSASYPPYPPARRPTTINILPQELKLEIAELAYAGMPARTREDSKAVLAHMRDLSRNLNQEWRQAFAQPLAAAGQALHIRTAPTGQKLADALCETSAIQADLQGSCWQAARDRLRAIHSKSVGTIWAMFLEHWPAQAPDEKQQAAWEKKRDFYIARFASCTLPKMAENFMHTVMQSRAPMDELVTTLLHFFEGQSDSTTMAAILDRLAPQMPAYCRPGFMAVRACMLHGDGLAMSYNQILEGVAEAPASLQWKLLVRLDKRISANHRIPAGGTGAVTQRLIDAIAALPLRQRRLALEKVPATRWEVRRTELVRQSLPSNLLAMTAYLVGYLDAFDTSQMLGHEETFHALAPLADIVLKLPCPTTTPALIKLMPLMARCTAADEARRSRVLQAFTCHQRKLPPREECLLDMLIAGLLVADGEPKLSAFRLGLHGLTKLPAKTVADALCTLCSPGHGLPPYVFMGSLRTLKEVMDTLPPDQCGHVRAAVFRLTGTFGAADAATARRVLGFAPGTVYFS